MYSNYAEDLTPCAPAGHPGVDMWNGLINAQALPIKVPPNLVKAHMLYESGGNQNAFHDEGDGTAGCGLMQITYGTFLVGSTWYYKGGATGGYPEPIFPPTLNVHVGVMDFIRFNIAAFLTNLDACIAAYNAGIPAVTTALADGVPLTSITTDPQYIPHVREAYIWFCQQANPADKLTNEPGNPNDG
jgi:soluble lytic murein transglycosylase-like protein